MKAMLKVFMLCTPPPPPIDNYYKEKFSVSSLLNEDMKKNY